MFIGHFGLAFALKRAAPRTSLGTLMAGVEFVDMLWPIFLLAGWEQVRIDPGNTRFTPLDFVSYPWTHSLVMAVVWAVVFGLVYFLRSRRRAAALIVGVAVASHWVLDWITHRPDLPLAPWPSPKVGLGLWNSVPATLIVELGMFAAGVWIYTRTTHARDRMGRLNFRIYVAVLLAMYVGNIVGPPPPDPRSLAIFGLGLWLFPFWAAWFDRHRAVAG
jgi:hypothetical protein